MQPDSLKSFIVSSNWESIEGIKEDWRGQKTSVGGWGRLIDGRQVIVLLNRCGDYHTTWRMYLDGEMVYHMKHIVTQMGSGLEATREAEKYMKSEKWKIGALK